MKYNIYDNSLQGALPVQTSLPQFKPMSVTKFGNLYKEQKSKKDKMRVMYDLISSHGLTANLDPEIRQKIMLDCGVLN